MNMMLSYELFESAIEIVENKINVIIIENPKALSKFLNEIIVAKEGNNSLICFSENFEEISVSKKLDIIFNPFDIEYNSKTVLNKLYAALTEMSKAEENYEKIMQMNLNVMELLFSLTEAFDGAITFSQEPDFSTLFKAYGLMFEYDFGNSLLEKIINYMTIYREFLKTDIFIFYNLKSLLDEDELKELYKYSFQKKINLILIESCLKSNLEDEIMRLIDNDLCEVV